MCGLLIVYSKKEALDTARCRRALSTMYWRGPDFSYSKTWENRLFSGQTVLSITGTPANGVGNYHRSSSGRFELYYNGEIYNHQELKNKFLQDEQKSSSYGTDTEVLSGLHDHLDAHKIPSLLDGMYAYGVVDFQEHKLHLARDPQGEKSLYIYEDHNLIVVASEIRAIHALVPGISIDSQALRDYFHTRHLMLFERTIYQGIHEIAPGSLLTLDLKSLQWKKSQPSHLKEWISPEKMEKNLNRNEEDLTDELDEIFSRCVKEMIPIDRKYASVVSGGVDSSLISSYVVKEGIPHLLIAVNNIGKDLISNNLNGFEKKLGRSIHTLQIGPSSYISEIGRCQHAAGGPLNAHSFIPQSQQSAFVNSEGCKVLLGGEGGDELFGGYNCYLDPLLPEGRFSPSFYTTYQDSPLKFTENNTSRLEAELSKMWQEAQLAYDFIKNPIDRRLMAMTLCDTSYQLPSVGLRSADLMSMMWSIETRSVFLRKPLVQFALNLPPLLKVNRAPDINPLMKTKYILKKLFLRHYPKELLFEKQGFAGFPNEAGKYLGDPYDFMSLEVLKINRETLPQAMQNRACSWKLINVEYFLRMLT